MLYPIPDAEIQRIHALKEYTLIESVGGLIKTNNNIFKYITTYHPYSNSIIQWYIHQKINKNKTIVLISAPGVDENINNDATSKNGHGEKSSQVKLYNIEINKFINHQDDNLIIHTTLEKIIQQQTPEHFTQFLIGCAAMQQVISPNPDDPIPYVAISPCGYKTPVIRILSTPIREHIITATMPLPNKSIIHSAENMSPTNAHNLHTHTIKEDGMPILTDIMGPWQHPMLEERIDIDGYGEGQRLYYPRLNCTQWPNSKNFMPPIWDECPNIREIGNNTQHTWIAIQRKIQKAAQQLQSYITPAHKNDE